MKQARRHSPLTSHLAQSPNLTPDAVSLLVAEALIQAHLASGTIEKTVIPVLAPRARAFAVDLLRRMHRVAIFTDGFVRDLESFMASLEAHIDASTSVYWQADEHHIAGGYEVTHLASDAKALASAARDLASLRDRLVAAVSASRAVRDLPLHFED
jgi:hypothetical protein